MHQGPLAYWNLGSNSGAALCALVDVYTERKLHCIDDVSEDELKGRVWDFVYVANLRAISCKIYLPREGFRRVDDT